MKKTISLQEPNIEQVKIEGDQEREHGPKFFQEELQAVACALQLNPYDEEGTKKALEFMNGREYQEIRKEVIRQLQDEFVFVRRKSLNPVIGSEFSLMSRPDGERTIRDGSCYEAKKAFELLTEAFCILNTRELMDIAKQWREEQSRVERKGKRIPLARFQERIEDLFVHLRSRTQVESKRDYMRDEDLRAKDLFLVWGLLSPTTYASEESSMQKYPLSLLTLDIVRQHTEAPIHELPAPPGKKPNRYCKNWYGEEVNAEFLREWSWLGPLVNKTAAFMGVDPRTYKDRFPDWYDEVPFAPSSIHEKDGVLLPLNLLRLKEAEELKDECQFARLEGKDLRVADEKEQNTFQEDWERRHQVRVMREKRAGELFGNVQSLRAQVRLFAGRVRHALTFLKSGARFSEGKAEMLRVKEQVHHQKQEELRSLQEHLNQTSRFWFLERQKYASQIEERKKQLEMLTEEMASLYDEKEQSEEASEEERVNRSIFKSFLNLVDKLVEGVEGLAQHVHRGGQ